MEIKEQRSFVEQASAKLIRLNVKPQTPEAGKLLKEINDKMVELHDLVRAGKLYK